MIRIRVLHPAFDDMGDFYFSEWSCLIETAENANELERISKENDVLAASKLWLMLNHLYEEFEIDGVFWLGDSLIIGMKEFTTIFEACEEDETD